VKLVLGEDATVAAWVAARIPGRVEFKDMRAIGIERAGVPVGGVVYHEYRGNDIQMSCAATTIRWLDKGVLRALFAYPFVHLKCDRVSAYTGVDATHTRQFLERLGFVQEGVVRRGFEEGDCVLYGMLVEECKWIKELQHG